ncbi:sugar phosphate isomerase/epimerase [Dolichospermum sp. ST_sed8]|nr:sugar phosphate isomerase/epimerase [Dolichospermum sp. ST_sed8]
MKLGVSAIGWEVEDHSEIVLHLPDGIELLEAVPFKRHSRFSGCLQKYSAQSLFYGMDIDAFGNEQAFDLCFAKLMAMAQKYEWKRMVLGSPGLRKGDRHYLMDALARNNNALAAIDCIVCIEPVARPYGGEYFFTVEEIVQSLAEYSLSHVATMIDTNSAWLESQWPEDVLIQYFPYIKHVHISDQNIGAIICQDKHERFADALRNTGYEGGVIRELLKAKNYPGEYDYFAQIYKPPSAWSTRSSIK